MADVLPVISFLKVPRFVTESLRIGRTFTRMVLCVVLFAGILLTPSTTRAAEFSSVELGYQRRALVGEWMPVRVSASGLTEGQPVALSLVTRDARGNRVTEVCASGTSAADGSITLSGLVRTGRLDGSIDVELNDSDSSETLCGISIACSDAPLQAEPAAVQRRLRLYRHNVRFVLTVGQQAGIEELLSRAETLSPDSPALVGVSVDSVDQLPREARAYSTVSTIVLSGGVSLTEQQFDAIRRWVYQGGHLIIGCADEITDLLQTSFGQWLDQHFGLTRETRAVTDADLAAMQQLVPQATRISTFRRTVNMCQPSSDQPVALAESGSVPLVARTGSGGGTLTFISVNLNQRPLSQWNSLADFYAVLILGSPLSKVQVRSSNSRISSSGIGDLTTQLMATADPQPRTGRWSAWSIIGLAFGWLVLIGPVDYFLVVVLLKRPHWTWVTFPLWVIAGCWGLYTLKAADPQTTLNDVHLVDVTQDGTFNSIRAMSLISLSTPYTSRATLTAVPNSELSGSSPQADLSWAGRPDDVYGGMYRATGLGAGSQTYTHDADEPTTLASVPLLIDGSFETQTCWAATPASPLVSSELSVSGYGLLNGSFRHELPSPLRDWVVVFGNRIYRARDDAREALEAGQSWEFLPGGSQISDLKSWLTGPRDTRSAPLKRAPGQSFSSQPYSVAGRDPLDIVIMMSLYDVAGAESYTGLNHDALGLLDMSDSIRLNYAVVVGWMDMPATHLEIDGEAVQDTQTTSIVRLLLPVNRRPASAAALTADKIKAAEEERQRAADAESTETSDDEDQDSTEQEPSGD